MELTRITLKPVSPTFFLRELLLSSVGVMNRWEWFITALLVFYILSRDPGYCNYCVLLHMHMFKAPPFFQDEVRHARNPMQIRIKGEGTNTYERFLWGALWRGQVAASCCKMGMVSLSSVLMHRMQMKVEAGTAQLIPMCWLAAHVVVSWSRRKWKLCSSMAERTPSVF